MRSPFELSNDEFSAKGYLISKIERIFMIYNNAVHLNNLSTFRTRSQVWDTTGMWAWLIHRITGLGILFYFFLHIALMGSSLLIGQKTFDAMLSVLMQNPLIELLDLLLLAAVLYHAFNGIRILLFDIGVGVSVRTQKIMFRLFMAIAAAIWVWAIVLTF
jgi:succinate dehydrogenase / fumarate reductase cytochrome b subunit